MKILSVPRALLCVPTFVITLSLSHAFPQSLHQEDRFAVESFIADLYEHYSEESGEYFDMDFFAEELTTLHQSPLDLNHSSREELERLLFLTPLQVENILYYVYRFGGLHSIYELQLIEGIDLTDIRRMLPFVTLRPANPPTAPLELRKVLRYGKQELLMRFDGIPERKKGYYDPLKDTASYLGSPIYHHLKYRFHYRDRVYFNLTAEKDAGEQFWGSHHKGYDFYSASLQLKKIGKLDQLILGDYVADFGQGLVLRQAFGGGKSSMATHIFAGSRGFRRYGSVGEFNFFRGIAISSRHHQLQWHAFGSLRSLDGNLKEEGLSSLYRTGLHRTALEYSKKNVARQHTIGGNITYMGFDYQLGLTALSMRLDLPIVPNLLPYAHHHFTGNQHAAAGFNYRRRWQSMHFFGEVAITEKLKHAQLHGLNLSPLRGWQLAMLYRNYTPGYAALFASAFSEGSGVTNEEGWYVGLEGEPFRRWRMKAYADSFRFPWLRHGADGPTRGKEMLLQIEHLPTRRLQMLWRLKYEQKEMNGARTHQQMNYLVETHKTSFRYQLVADKGQVLFKTILEANSSRRGSNTPTIGAAAMQEVSLQFAEFPLKADLRYAIVNAPQYDNRIYLYEKDVLHAFSIPVLYGVSSRYYLNLRYDLSPALTLWLKLARTQYADFRTTIGSGLETIEGNRRTEIKALTRWRIGKN